MTCPRLSPTRSMSQCGSSSCAMRIVYAVSITIGCSVFPSALRARIEGAVIRLPGTGTGVARLVEVSIVKVDMARACNGRALTSPEDAGYARVIQGTFTAAQALGTTGAWDCPA